MNHKHQNSVGAIFPDEIDEADRRNKWAGVTTRSGNNRITVFTKQKLNIDTNAPSTSQQVFYELLAKWKKDSIYFKECVCQNCDPLGQFIKHQKALCKYCVPIRNKLREKLIIVFKSEDLFPLLADFIYFHTIKIFDPDAERRYAKTKSRHPYYTGYNEFRQANNLILENIASSFNFSTDLRIAAGRPYMSYKRVKSKQDLTEMGLLSACQICQNGFETEFPYMFRIFTFQGSRYMNNFELLKGEPPKPTHFVICPLHSTVFISFYYITHIDWNVHWNLYFRVRQLLPKMPDSSAAELINAIDPKTIKVLAKFYIVFYKRLNFGEWSYYKERSYPLANSDLTGVVSWYRMKNRLKDAAIFQHIIREGRLKIA